MGKRLHNQRRGRGSNAYTKPPNHYKADVTFGKPVADKVLGEVIELVDDPGHSAPLMRIRYDGGIERMYLAPEGIRVGDKIEEGGKAVLSLGNVLPLDAIPEGVTVYNVESIPGDGGKLVRAAGNSATVVAHIGRETNVMLPSKRIIALKSECRAEIGAVAGGGQQSMPIMTAGKNHYIKHATNTRWPLNRGVKSNPVDHPFGGKQHHKGASSMTSRNAPPGAKVGHIAASRVGRRKRG